MKMLRVFRRTITITSSETWTISVESNQPIEDLRLHSPADAQLPIGSDVNPTEREQPEAEQFVIPGLMDDSQYPTKPMIEHGAIIKIEPPTPQ